MLLLDRPTTAPRKLSRELRMEREDLAIVHVEDPRAPWPDEPVGGPALVVHSPQPVISERPLPFLYGAQREAKMVLEKFARATELSGAVATPRGVVEGASGHGLIHFAVHGEARTGEGAASYLQLGGPEGRLQVIDVLRLRLKEHRPVVVLSACNTGDVPAHAEHDGAGLPWAFLRAGARAVVAYQDALRDEVGLAFSRVLYDEIGAGVGLAEAFERAIASIRKAHGAEAAAAFVLII
jgi:CHAT domain-containing protein